MPTYIFDPINEFREKIPFSFLEDTTQLLFDCYLEAYQNYLKLPKWERRDARSTHRRALFESQWRELAKGYGEIEATVVPNSKSTAFHTEIGCEGIILVESFVATPQTIVRPAIFRKTLTMRYQPLFELDEQQESDRLFAILIHGAADERSPAFADIVFPLRDSENGAYHDARIQLFDWFEAIIASRTNFQEELVPDEIEPELREDIPNIGGA